MIKTPNISNVSIYRFPKWFWIFFGFPAKTTNSNFKVKMCSNRLDVSSRCQPVTENKRAVQVYIFRYCVHIQHPHSLAVKVSRIRVNDTCDQGSDQGSDPGGVKILIFQMLIPLRFWDVLGYIDTHLGWYSIAHMV